MRSILPMVPPAPRPAAVRPYVLAGAGLAVLFLAANWPVVTGQGLPVWDAHSLVTAMQLLIADHARAGQLLRWNPWSNAGSPDFCDPNYGALSPLVVAFSYLGGSRQGMFVAYWLCTWFAGGLGLLFLLRYLRVPAWGAFVVTAGFLFSGYYTGHAEHTPILHAYSALPWVVWRWDVALRSARYWPAVEAGAILGVSALAGYPSVVLLIGGVMALWSAGRWCWPEPDWQAEADGRPAAARPGAGFVVAALVLAAGVASVILCPSYLTFLVEGKGYSERSGPLPWKVAVEGGSLHPGALATFSSPYFALLKLFNRGLHTWPSTDVSMFSLYTGLATPWLALAAVVARPRSGWRWWLFLIGLVGLGLAMSQTFPLRGWLYDFCPPSRYFKHAALFRCELLFALSVLAALACRDLDRFRTAFRADPGAGPEPADRPAGLGRVWLLTAALAALAVTFAHDWALGQATLASFGPDIGLANVHRAVGWAAVFGLGLLAFARGRAGAFRPLPLALVVLTLLDVLLTARLSRSTVYEDTPRLHALWRDLERDQDTSLVLTPQGLNRQPPRPGKDNLNIVTKTPLLANYSPFKNRFHELWAKDPLLVKAATGPDRLWFVPARAAADVHLSDATFEAFQKRAAELGAPPILVHQEHTLCSALPPKTASPLDAPECQRIGSLPPGRKLPAEVRCYEANTLALDVQAPEAGFLVVTDRWARGWRARVNGTATPVLGANFLFRAVPVQPGLNRVVFEYHPFGYPWLLLVSWSLLGVITSVSAWRGLRLLRASRAASVGVAAADGWQPDGRMAA